MTRSRLFTGFASLLLLVPAACASEGASQHYSADSGQGISTLREKAARHRITAGFLVVDGVYNTELTAPWDILEHTGYHTPQGTGIEVITVSPDGGPITTAEGLRLQPDFSFNTAPAIDILVVPSAHGSRDTDLENATLIEWVAQTGQSSQAIMSLCWGAFILAEAGLLDDRKATTFPSDYGAFARRFPDLELLVNVSFVHDRNAITSQGGVRSFDAAMYLVDLLYGEDVARNVGAGLLIPWPAVDVPFVVSTPALP